MNWLDHAVALLWQNALAVIPVALAAALACRFLRLRPTTRYGLWMVALLWFVIPLAAPFDAPPPPTQAGLSAAPAAQSPLAAGTADAAPTAAPAASSPAPPTAGLPEFAQLEPRAADPPLGRWLDLLPVRLIFTPPDLRVSDAPIALDAPATAPEQPVSSEPAPAAVASADAAPQPAPAQTRPVSGDKDWQLDRLLGPAALAVAQIVAFVSGLPTLPPAVWLSGAGLVVLWNVLGVALFKLRTRRWIAPPRWVEREMELIAARLKLRRVPQVRIVETRISPLVWCGRRPRLYLPLTLWMQLDRVSRRAILCHELAHLRRRDHWVCWVRMAIAVAYWWHPVAWWACRRLDEEADACCDAWVTWLMPQQRRAYAQALLATRAFVDHKNWPVPCGAAVLSPSAERLSRRLNMVMTQTTGPRYTLAGLLVVSALAAAGWAATPALLCPPKDHGTKPESPAPPPAPLSDDAADETPAPKAVRVRLPSLLKPALPQSAPAKPAKPAKPAAPAIPHALSAGPLQVGVSAPIAPQAAPAGTPDPVAPRMPSGFLTPDAPAVARFLSQRADGPVEAREYRLPEGKLDALTQLMIRNDVPIPVSAGKGVLTVHATPQQHAVFQQFIRMIHPDGASARHGRAPQAVEQERRAAEQNRARSREQRAKERLGMEQRKQQAQARVEALRSTVQQREQHLVEQLKQYEARAREMERAAAELEAQAEKMRQEMESLSEQRPGEAGDDDEPQHSDRIRRQMQEHAQRTLTHERARMERELARIASQAAKADTFSEDLREAMSDLESRLSNLLENDLDLDLDFDFDFDFEHEHDADQDSDEEADGAQREESEKEQQQRFQRLDGDLLRLERRISQLASLAGRNWLAELGPWRGATSDKAFGQTNGDKREQAWGAR